MTAPFDISLDELRLRTSAKWSAVDPDVLPAWVAEMDVRVAPAITEALHRAVDLGDLGYVGDPTLVVEALAGFARDTWGWETGAEGQVRTFSDVGHAASEILRSVCRPGDRVVINPPVYNSFYAWLSALDLEPLEVPLLDVEQGGRLDLAGLGQALAEGARVVLLCSPHNPLGLVHPRSDLEALAQLADRYDALVISDEIHAPLVHPGSPTPFVPWLTVSDAARRVGLALHSPSKAWNTAGLKCAVGAVHDPARWPELPEEVAWAGSILGRHAAVAAWRDSRAWLEQVRRELESRTALTVDLLAEHLPQVRFHPGHASYLAWLDCRELGLADPAATFRERGAVEVSPGPIFGPGNQGWVRLNIGTSEELLVEAVRRMASAVR